MIRQHLLDRRLDINKHQVWLDESNNLATFPIWNLNDQLIGYQQYNPIGSKKANEKHTAKYFTYSTTPVIVWGLESWSFSNELYICEGIFDAAALTWHNKAAIAVFSNKVSTSVKNWLYMIRSTRKTIAICDNDAAGKSLASLAHTYHTVAGYKDLGDAPNSYIERMLNGL